MKDDTALAAGPAQTAAFAVVLPDEPVPIRLMNTIWADRHGVHDAVTTPDDLRAWLLATHPGRHEPTAADVKRFRALRDALRRLAALVVNDARPAAASAIRDVDRAVAVVNDAAAQAPTWPQLGHHEGDLRAVAAGGATSTLRALSSIAHQSIELLTGADRVRLRACYAPGCVLYFVKDHPRREWCSTACGNRARAARHYRRHHKSDEPDA